MRCVRWFLGMNFLEIFCVFRCFNMLCEYVENMMLLMVNVSGFEAENARLARVASAFTYASSDVVGCGNMGLSVMLWMFGMKIIFVWIVLFLKSLFLILFIIILVISSYVNFSYSARLIKAFSAFTSGLYKINVLGFFLCM